MRVPLSSGPRCRWRRLALPVALLAPAAWAQTWPALFEQAWLQREPVSAARQAQGQARRDAAGRWLAEPPALTLATRDDRLGERRGQREFEAELALPLNLPAQRDAGLRAAEAGLRADAALRDAERWRLAGVLRESAWALHLARAEAAAAARQQREAEALRDDTARRVGAGELAPLDLNTAQATATRAAAAAMRATQAVAAAEAEFGALAPSTALPAGPENDRPAPDTQDADALAAHPLLTAARERLAMARARLAQTEARRRGTPELALGLSRERGGAGEPWQARARVALRVPFGGAAQTELPVREAAVALAEAEADLLQQERQLRAQLAAAQQAQRQAVGLQALAEQRRALAAQALQWTRQAHAAGQFDLPTLLRAQADAADAEVEAERARVESARALSRLHQSLGLLP